MARQTLEVIKKVFILFIVILMIRNELIAQCTKCVGDVPQMWVPKNESIKRARQFTKPAFLSASKYKRLCRIIGETEKLSLSYPKETFDKLLGIISATSGYANLRIYIASVDPDNKYGITNITDKTLIIIFAPAGAAGIDMEPQDIGAYYIIDEKNEIQALDKTTKDKWTSYYESLKMEALKKTIKHYKNESENRISKEYFDTRSMYYSKKMICDYFYCEPIYQSHVGNNIDGYRVNFSAYTRKGDKLKCGMFKKRLHVLFEYTIEGKIFYIDEDQNYFKKRLKTTTTNLRAETNDPNAIFRGGDNGQLCPANCP